jgi:hypothetical protein
MHATAHGEGFKTPHIQHQGCYPQNGTVYYNFLKHSPFLQEIFNAQRKNTES